MKYVELLDEEQKEEWETLSENAAAGATAAGSVATVNTPLGATIRRPSLYPYDKKSKKENKQKKK